MRIRTCTRLGAMADCSRGDDNDVMWYERLWVVLVAVGLGLGPMAKATAAGAGRGREALQRELLEVPVPVCGAGGWPQYAGGRHPRLECARPPGDHGVRQALGAVYRGRDFRPLWIHDGRPTPQALAVLRALVHAARFGLRPSDYRAGDLNRRARTLRADAGQSARSGLAFDVELSSAVLQFIVDLHYGRVDPRTAGFHLTERRAPFDLTAALLSVADGPNVLAAIHAVEPHFYHYRLLEQALQRYRVLARRAGLTDLPRPKRPLRLGDRYVGAPALRRLLAALGDLDPAQRHRAGSTEIIDSALDAAVRRYQARHGLRVDGIVGRATFAALTTPLADRVLQIDLTLERWRWLPVFHSPPIIVNIPQFRLFAFRSTADRKADILQMNVIVGKNYPLMRTPVFTGELRYIVFRPYWNVPQDIMRRELLPRIRSDPGYLAKEHLQIVRGRTDEATPLPLTAKSIAALAAGELRVRQLPGADNALGLIKFIFPNAHQVYLHSTPARDLFHHVRRAFSHGCIRVSHPVALAALVLRHNAGEWTAGKIEAAMHGRETFRVMLAKPVPVMILYGTVLATESGKVLFFADIYGDDRRLAALLHLAVPVR